MSSEESSFRFRTWQAIIALCAHVRQPSVSMKWVDMEILQQCRDGLIPTKWVLHHLRPTILIRTLQSSNQRDRDCRWFCSRFPRREMLHIVSKSDWCWWPQVLSRINTDSDSRAHACWRHLWRRKCPGCYKTTEGEDLVAMRGLTTIYSKQGTH